MPVVVNVSEKGRATQRHFASLVSTYKSHEGKSHSTSLRTVRPRKNYISITSLITRLPKATPRTSDPPRQLDILLHYGDTLGVDGAQVGVFEQVDHECLGGFLKGLYGLALPAQGVAIDGEEGETDFSNLEFYVNGEKSCRLHWLKRTHKAGEREFQK